jgi:hypothetical protein
MKLLAHQDPFKGVPTPFASLAVNSVFSSEYEPMTISAPTSRREASEKLVVRPAEKQPAALAATIPFTASSITRHAAGAGTFHLCIFTMKGRETIVRIHRAYS